MDATFRDAIRSVPSEPVRAPGIAMWENGG